MPRKNEEKVNFSINLNLYYGAVAVIILGYIFLSLGNANSITSLTLGPIILVIGYLIAMPIALLSGIGKKENGKDLSESKKEPAS